LAHRRCIEPDSAFVAKFSVLLQALKLFEYHQIFSGLKTLCIFDFQELCIGDKQVERMELPID
jgi:hypothetical protein